MEILTLKKFKVNVVQVQTTGEVERDEMHLVTHRHGRVITLEKSRSCSSVPIIVTTNITPNYSRKSRISSLFGSSDDHSNVRPHKLPGSVEAGVKKLVENLCSDSLETIRAAIAELRSLSKLNTDNRIIIAEHGAISFLVKLLYSTDAIIQEHAATTLLNLSINTDNKVAIAQGNAIEPLIHVLDTGTREARENAAATFYSLALVEENRVMIGRSGAIGPLVELLGNGSPRGRKDAMAALFYLSRLGENRVKIVQAGAVKHLVELMDPSIGMVDKIVSVLANLAAIQEGKVELGREGAIPVLVEAIELGSARGKENATVALLQICSSSDKFCIMALQEGVIPPLVALSQSGTPRAKDKAQKLLKLFRKHVDSNVEKH